MKKVLTKLLMFFGLLILLVLALFQFPYSKEFAYHFIENDCYNHGAWIYDRIAHNSSPIDIAFIGSSHTIHAFHEKTIEDNLNEKLLPTNLGYCRYGRNLQYLLLKLLLEHKEPKLIVLEVHEDEEKNSHDIFPFLADSRDLIFTPTPINRDYFSDLFHGTSARLEQLKAHALFSRKYPESSKELYGCGESDRTVTQEEITQNEEAWKRRLSMPRIKMFEQIQSKYPMAYLEKITGLIDRKNIQLVFVYLPEYGSKLQRPRYWEYYQKIAPVLTPPDSILKSPKYWMDATHLNNQGARMVSNWISKEISTIVCTDSVRNFDSPESNDFVIHEK